MIRKLILFAGTLVAFYSCQNQAKEGSDMPKTEFANGVATSTFKVWGNCGMCKKTIENSLKTEGISNADWDSESKLITVEYDTSKITLDQIQKQIAAVGYDNVTHKGSDSAYKNLHECCKYDRK